MATVATRLVRRPSEVRGLDLDDISFGSDPARPDWMAVRVRRAKNDPLGKEGMKKWMPVEPSGSLACPVRAMRKYLELRGSASGPLFIQEGSGRRVPPNIVSDVARKMAAHAGLCGTFSGYSFRIGGATLMAFAGVPLSQIQAVAGWRSDVYLRYLRSVAAAESGVSSRMGL